MKRILIPIILIPLTLVLATSCKSPTLPALDEPTAMLYNPDLKPFYHGVASGDPLADAVVIWTRITPEAQIANVAVDWELATDSAFDNIVRSGTIETGPQRDYTVKIDVNALEPNTVYFYRFHGLDGTSITGRTRTAPEKADTIRFAVASCSNYEWGYFNAYAGIAEEPELQAVLHLGDYIYEHGVGVYGDTTIGRLHIPNREILSLKDYRTRYAQYRLDADLRAAHKNHPFIVIWDDHEITNNAYKDGAQNHQDDEGDYADRKAIARQVYYEWMPIRESEQLYRKFAFGELADLVMLDGRLAGRTKQAENMEQAKAMDSMQRMLGPVQFQWLCNNLETSETQWNVIGNQVIFSYQDWGREGFRLNMDAWDGYPYEQHKLADFIRDNEVENVIFVTGDTHTAWALEATEDPFENYDPETGAGSVGIEFGVTSISAANSNERFSDSAVIAHENKLIQSGINPHLRYTNMRDHGYLLLTLTDSLATADFKIIETTKKETKSIRTDRTYHVRSGSNRLIANEQ